MSLRDTISLSQENVIVTIAAGQSESSILSVGGLRLGKIVMPTAWTNADITFSDSVDDGITWNPMYDAAGVEYIVRGGALKSIPLDMSAFATAVMLKVRSGTSAAPIVQTADRAITLVLRNL